MCDISNLYSNKSNQNLPRLNTKNNRNVYKRKHNRMKWKNNINYLLSPIIKAIFMSSS